MDENARFALIFILIVVLIADATFVALAILQGAK